MDCLLKEIYLANYFFLTFRKEQWPYPRRLLKKNTINKNVVSFGVGTIHLKNTCNTMLSNISRADAQLHQGHSDHKYL